MTQALIQIRDLKKSYGPSQALAGATIDFYPGRVHTLLGENGAGKSTLIKVLAGLTAPSDGSILLSGRPYAPSSRMEALSAGVSVVFQELSLSANLTVAENIFAGREPSRLGFVDQRRLHRQAQDLLDRLGFRIKATTRVASLSLAERQLVEIAKGLSFRARVVVMDEPTSSLSDTEANRLFELIQELKNDNVAIIYVSHRMNEILRISDDITVMRDGRTISTEPKADSTIPSLIAKMVGWDLQDVFPAKPPRHADAAPVLSLRKLTAPNYFSDISFDLAPGEILGFFGLVGSGRSDVMRAIFGHQPTTHGDILLDGHKVEVRHPIDAIRHGIGFATENRKEEGLVLAHSIGRNIAAVRYAAIPSMAGFAQSGGERTNALAEITRLGIKAHAVSSPAASLSGGNQQKVVLGKWLAIEPRILILDEPTRGIDVGAKFEIYRIIRQLAANGTAILLVSSELPEVVGLSDRIAIMHEKRITAILNAEDTSPSEILSLAAGVSAPEGEAA